MDQLQRTPGETGPALLLVYSCASTGIHSIFLFIPKGFGYVILRICELVFRFSIYMRIHHFGCHLCFEHVVFRYTG